MTRYLYGGKAEDFVVVPTPVLAGPAGNTYNTPAAGASGTLWTAQTGGTQVTDLLTYPGGVATSSLSQNNGFITQFQGPDSTGTQGASFWAPNLWADFGGSSRIMLRPQSPLAAGNIISVSPSGGIVDVSAASAGSIVRVNVNANITAWQLNTANPSASYSFQVVLTMDSTPGRTVVWPSASNVKYPSGYGSVSAFTPGIANAITTYNFSWDGTNWYITPELVTSSGLLSVSPSSGAVSLASAIPSSTIAVNVNANITSWTLPPVVSGSPASYTLILTQDATGGRTVVWPASVKTPGGYNPSSVWVPGIPNAVSTYQLRWDGTNWWISQDTFDTGWQNATLLNSWQNFGSPWPANAGYRRINNLVEIKGLVKNVTTTQTGIIWTMPVGYRPTEQRMFLSVANTGMSRMSVDTSGNVNLDIYLASGAANFVNTEFFFQID